MNEKERLLSVLQGDRVDRPPVICPGGMMSACVTEISNRMGGGHHSGATAMVSASRKIHELIGFENYGVPYSLTPEVEALGASVNLGDNLIEPRVTRYNDQPLEAIMKTFFPVEVTTGKTGVVLEAIRELRNSQVPVIGNVSGHISTATSVVDPLELFKLMRRDHAALRTGSLPWVHSPRSLPPCLPGASDSESSGHRATDCKSQLVDSETIDKIISSLKEFNPDGEILSKPWDALGPEEFESLLAGHADLELNDILHTNYKPCRENEFEAMALRTSRAFSQQELELCLSLLSQPQYGQVLRGKGFLKSPQGCLDFSYTNGQFMVSLSKFKSSGKLCLIGKNLNEKEIRDLFKVESEGLFIERS